MLNAYVNVICYLDETWKSRLLRLWYNDLILAQYKALFLFRTQEQKKKYNKV